MSVQLNIFKTTTSDVTRALLRCRQDQSQTLGDVLEAPGQLAIHAADLPGVPEANCAYAPDVLTPDQVDAVDAAFGRRGGRCLRWISPAASDALRGRGFVERSVAVLRLARWERREPLPLMILQARAANTQTRELLSDIHAGDAAQVRAGERRLDDPKFELLLALEAGRAVGCIGLLISGDAAAITSHHTLPSHRGRGIGRALADRAIEFAARSTLRHVLIGADEADAALLRFYAGVGFDRAGRIVEYDLA